MIEMRMLLLMGVLVTTLVLLAIIGFLSVSWFKKRKQHRQLEQLLDEIKERQDTRKNKLARKFARHFDMGENDAQGISEQLIGAERRFLQQYIDQLLKQKPSDIVYDQLCDLLDYYLNSLVPRGKDASQPAETADTAPPVGEMTANEQAAGETQNTPEPDWGDVFD